MSTSLTRVKCGILFATFLLAGAVIPAGVLQARDHLVFGSDRDYPPYEYLNERGEPIGFNIDIVRALARQLGTPIQIRLDPWPEVVRQLEVEKSIDITDMFYTAERARRVEYTVPFAVAYDEVFVRSDTPQACVYENLVGKEVIVQGASTTEEFLAANIPGVRLVPVDSEPAALRLLAAGFHDCAVVTRVAGRLAIQKYRLTNLIASGKPVRPRDYAFVVAKGNLALRDRINTAIVAIEANGEYQKIYDRWFGGLEPPRPAQVFLRTYGWWALGATLVLVLGIVVWSRSLTLQVGARTRELALSSQRLRDLFDSASDALLVVEPGSGRILDANRRTTERYGYRREELLGMRVHDLGPPEAGPQADAAMQRVMTEGHALFERTLRHRDGQYFHAEISSRLVELDGRQVIESNVRDLSERVEAATRLHESERRLRDVLKAVQMGTWEWDMVSGDVRWSENVAALFGLPAGSFSGNYAAYLQCVYPEDRSLLEGRIQLALTSDIPYEVEHRILWPDGSIRWLAGKGRVYRTPDGKPVRIAGTVMDVTQRKQGDLEREQLLHDLERRTAEMESFVYTISHDLKAPLITIHGFARLLEKDLARGDTAQVVDSLDEILKASEGMEKLIEDLLALARTGLIVGESKEVVLADLLADLASRCAHHIEQERASVRLMGELPRLRVDPVRFGQVLQNLIENALTYHRPNVPPEIEIGAQRVEGEFRLYVRDNGVGIPAIYQERIFGLFQRLDTHTEGTGVGLAIVRRIVEMHGGRIWVESEPGKGSIFWIALPESAVVSDASAVEGS
jgi:PAS domain S-box-containing protein